MNDLEGRTFGRWVVQEPLPHGGRGALYRAQATDAADLRAAIRFIDASDPAEIRRSETEYELLRSEPTYVIRVYDFGVDEIGASRLARLVMELPDEESLAERMQRGALSFEEQRRLGAQMALALVGVHRLQVAHLDLKPANILMRGGSGKLVLPQQDAPKLVGFGAAQRVGALAPAAWEPASPYRAPEQLDPHAPVTCASDIYALGAMLLDLAARTPNADPGQAGRHDMPPALIELIARMLGRDPAARPDISEVGERLFDLELAASRQPDRTHIGTRTVGGLPSPQPQPGVLVELGGDVAPEDSSGLWERVTRWFGTARSHPMPTPMTARDLDALPGQGTAAAADDPVARHGGASKPAAKAVAYAPDDLEDPALESMPAPQADAGVLYWNIGFPGNDAVSASRMLITGTPYALETALQAARAAHSFSQAKVGAKDLLGNSAEVPVKFVIEARGARVRVQGSLDWATSIASDGLTCRTTGTDVFRAEVQADAAGPVSITVTLHVRGAITLREVIALHAVGIPNANAGAGAPADRAEPIVDAEVSAAAIEAGHEATLVLRLEPFERWYALKIAAGGVEDAAVLHTCATTAELAKEAVLARKKLVALSKRYRAEPAGDADPFAGLRPADRGEALLEIARIGRRLHALVFGEPEENVPLDLTRIADLIRGHGQSAAEAPRMQIDAETLPFPWGIVYDAAGPLDSVADVALRGFWGRRFMIDRTISAILRSLPPPVLDGAIQPCLNPHLDTEESLAVVASQRGFFDRIARRSNVRRAIESGDQFRAYLKDEGITAPSILYFFCHARAAHEMSDQLFQIAATADEQASLLLDPSGSQGELSVGELRKLRKAPLKARPLVFLNACSSAEADQYYQSQFLTLFVSQWQARAFIGSDWKIPTEFADAFARRALDRFLGDDPEAPRLALGAALHATAAEVLELKNPFPLIYALYGRPELLAARA